MKSKRFKKCLSLILAIVLTLGLCQFGAVSASAADRYSDTSGHWAKPAIERWSDYGVLNGNAGMFRPDTPITRAEMATVLTKVIGYTAVGANPFSDVNSEKWYYGAVLKLATAGIMRGSDGKARPEDNITREEAAALIVRAFGIPEKANDPNPFKDAGSISSWAAGSVGGLHMAGYISGKPGGNFDPKASITRAEVVTIMDNFIKAFYNAPGEYSGNVTGNAVVRADGVILKDMKISGDLYLAEGIGSGDAVLDNVTVAKTTYIRGGGPNSIRVTGGNLGIVELNSLTKTHLDLSADTKVSKITILDTATVTQAGVSVAFDTATGTLTLGGAIDQAVLNANGTMTVTAGGIIYEVIPPAGANIGALTLSAGSVVKELSLNAPLHITGTGQIDKLSVHANGAVIDSGVNVKLENITVDRGITVTVNGKTYSGTGGALSSVNGTSGGGGGDNPTPIPDPNKVTVSFQTNGGSAITPIALTQGTTLPSVPMPVRENSAFAGWYTDQAFNNTFYSDTPIERNTTLYADYTAQNADLRTHVNPDKYVEDCDPQHTITILSPVTLNETNLSDYVEFTSYSAEFPQLQVTGNGDAYTLSPKSPYYEAGALYKLSLKDEGLSFSGEDEVVRSLSFRIHKEEIQNIEFKDGIIEILWADTNDLGNGAYTVPSAKYEEILSKFDALGQDETLTARFWDGESGDSETIEYHNIVQVEDLGGGLLLLITEDSEIDDVFDDFELYLEKGIPLEDIEKSIDKAKIANNVKNGEGAAQIAAILNAALAESPTLQALLEDEAGQPLKTMAAYSGVAPLEPHGSYFEENTLTGPHTPEELEYLLGLAGLAVENLEVTVDVYGTDMINFGVAYDPACMWPMLEITLKYKAVLANKVQVEAEVKLREHFAVSLQGWNQKSGLNVDFDYALNFYSETDLELSVLIKSVDKPPEGSYEIDVTEEIEKIFGDAATENGGAASILKKVLGDKGDDITLAEVEMFELPVPINILGLEVARFTFTVDFVVRTNFAVGIASDMNLLFARQVGIAGSTKGAKLGYYEHELAGNNRYDIDVYAAGYLGLKVGFKGSVDFSVLGLRDLGKIGVSLELGAYADLYGFVHARIVKTYPNDAVNYGIKQSEFSGALYLEVGVYLEIALFAESEIFNASAVAPVFTHKFPLFNYGDRYVLSRFVNSGKTMLMRADSLPLKGGYGMFDAEFIDMTTGEIIQGNYAEPSQFSIYFSNDNFYVENGEIKINKSNIGPDTVRLDATASIFYSGGALSFGGGSTTFWDTNGNPVTLRTPREVKLTWIDPSIDLSQYTDIEMRTAKYYLVMNGAETLLDEREVLFGEAPGAPNVPYTAYDWDVGKTALGLVHGAKIVGYENDFNMPIFNDTDYKILMQPYQRLVSFLTFHDDEWHFDVYAVNSGEKPKIPAGYNTSAPEKVFAGWHVYGAAGYTQGNNYLADVKPLEGVYAYGIDYVYSGLGTTTPLHSVSGTYEECRNAWYNGEYQGITFTRQSLALYEADYASQSYDITFKYPAIAGHSAWQFDAPFDHGQKITPHPYVPNYAGCELLGWDAGSDGTADYTTETLPTATGNATFTAVMKLKTFSVKVLDWSDNPSNTLTVDYGDPPVFPSMPDAANGNRQPTHWEVSVDGGASFAIWNKWDYPGVYADWTIKPAYNDARAVTFFYIDETIKTHTVMLTPGDYDIADYIDHTQLGYTSEGKRYVFSAWEHNGNSTNTFTVVDEDIRIVAAYRDESIPDTAYTVTFRTEYGELSKGGLSYGVLSQANQLYTFTAEPAEYEAMANAFIAINSAFTDIYEADKIYTFSGWGTPNVDVPSRTVQYIAVWDGTNREYDITYNAGDGTFIALIGGGNTYTQKSTYNSSLTLLDYSSVIPPDNAGSTYTLTGWEDQNNIVHTPGTAYTVMGDTIFTAVYSVAAKAYTVIISVDGGKFADGTTIDKVYSGDYGDPTGIVTGDTGTPTKDSTAQYTYTFSGWSSTTANTTIPTTFTENVTLTAQYTETPRTYTITFDANGGIFPGDGETYTKDYAYGATIDPADIPEPTRAEETYYTYTFASWELYGALQSVTKDATYGAIWTKTYKGGMPLPTGIYISDGVNTEEITAVTLAGYTYEPDNWGIPTLTITGNGLTVSGAVTSTINGPEDTVQIVIGENVTDVTFANLSLIGLDEYSNIISIDTTNDSLEITIEGDCSLEKPNSSTSGAIASVISSHRDTRIIGADGSAQLSITATKAMGVSYYANLTFEGLRITMDVSGMIDESEPIPFMARAFNSDSYAELSFIDASVTINSPGSRVYGNVVISGSTDFEYISTDGSPAFTTTYMSGETVGGALIFKDFTGIFSAFATTGPAILARSITFTDGDPADYGVILGPHVVMEDEEPIDYLTFVDGSNNPLSIIIVTRI